MNFPPPSYSLSEIPEKSSKNYNTRDNRSRKQPTKDYRAFISQSKIWASRTTQSSQTHIHIFIFIYIYIYIYKYIYIYVCMYIPLLQHTELPLALLSPMQISITH